MPSRSLRAFLKGERASLSVEAVMIFPLLLWAYFGMFILFDGYRTMVANERAAYTIGDLLSRETDYVTPTYLDGMNDVLDVLTQSPHRTVLRVSAVKYKQSTDSYELSWSYATAGKDAIAAGTLSQLVPYIPVMADSGEVVVVETWLAFEPFMHISLDSFYFQSLVVTRPRFAAQVVYSAT